MNFIEWLTKREKPLSKMTRRELRRQELLLGKERDRLLRRVEKIAKDKQTLFERGAQEKTPEVRRVLAQEFELKTTEQLMLGRQLNVRSKEMLTVSRLRMLRENTERTREAGSQLGLISEKDIMRLSQLIERDSISAEVYQERLDEILSIGAIADEEAKALTPAGETVMNIWNKLDAGAIADATEAFDEADRRVREQQQAPAE
jgi:hypothetical protein